MPAPSPKSIGFPPISAPDAQVLILGSLPGTESLRQQQYYAKKQNRFWWIMGELIGAGPDFPYARRLSLLTAHHIALWDVCHSAIRPGSLDSAITEEIPNDFITFLKARPHIKKICFNGRAAEMIFTRKVLPTLPTTLAAIRRETLPSTSPAHAGMPPTEKLRQWRQALASVVTLQ